MSWELHPPATGYDLVVGSLGALPSTGGSFATATAACLANDTALSWYDDAAPQQGGSRSLARAVSAVGVGSFDDRSPTEASARDPGIASSGAACP